MNIINSPSSPYFAAKKSGTIIDVTGDGTIYQAIFDTLIQGGNYNTSTGVFTASTGGLFLFLIRPEMTSVTSVANPAVYTLVTTSKTYTFANYNVGGWRGQSSQSMFSGYIFAPMNTNDMAYVDLQVSNATKTVGFGNGVAFFNAARVL
jgi:hypothetical protein